MIKILLFNINRFFAKIFPFSININGAKFYYDSLDRLLAIILWKFGVLEKSELTIFKKLIKPNMVFIDIGANMGIYSFTASKLLNESGKVIAFEPNKSHFETMRKSIFANRINNITLYNKGVGNMNNTLTLKIDPLNSGNYQVKKEVGANTSIDEEVEIVSLDSFLGETKVDIVKMDVQGFEFFVLQGMKNILKRNKQCIVFCEYWYEALKENGISPEDFISLIKEIDFNIFFIDKKGEKLIKGSPEDLIKATNGYLNIILSTSAILDFNKN